MAQLFIITLLLIILFSIFLNFYTYKKMKTQAQTQIGKPDSYHTLSRSEKQLRSIQHANFQRKKVMNLEEYILYKRLDGYLRNGYPNYSIYPQVVMGSYLQCPKKNAYSAINSKRTDFLIVDPNGIPIIAIEYQGKGHYQADAPYRDTIKREALRKSGIHYREINHHYDEKDIYAIGQLIDKSSLTSNT